MRVLFLTHRLPYAPNRGDRVRAFHIVRTLAPRVELELVSLVHDEYERAQADSIRALGVRVTTCLPNRLANYAKAIAELGGTRPLTHVLLDAPGVVPSLREIVNARPPDVVLAYCSGMARFAIHPPLSDYPFVLDLVDVDSAKWSAMAAAATWPRRWIYRREAGYLSCFEREAAMLAYTTLVVNERESRTLRQLAPDAAVRVVALGVDLAHLQPPSGATERPQVVFCGVMDYEPNVEGVLWFAREVWPAIRASRPEAEFVVVGSRPGMAVRRLASVRAGIRVTGSVPDVRSYLWDSAVSVAPLMTARGVQNKVLEAIGAGLPAVVTSQVFDGLPREVQAACAVADSPEGFARHTLALLALSGAERRAVAARADLIKLGWESQLAPLLDILAGAASTGRGRIATSGRIR